MTVYQKVILENPKLTNFSVVQRSIVFEGEGPQGSVEEDLRPDTYGFTEWRTWRLWVVVKYEGGTEKVAAGSATRM